MSLRHSRSVFAAVIFLALGGVHGASWADEHPGLTDQQSQRFQESISRLSSGSFAVREAAARELWEMGPSIEPILIQEEKTAGLDERMRIASVRKKFAIGLTADMPQAIQNLILTVVDERDPAKQTAGLIELTKKGFTKPVVCTLPSTEPQAWQPVVTTILNSIEKQPRSEETDSLVLRLIEITVTTPGRAPTSVTSQILQSPLVRNRTDEEWLKKVLTQLSKSSPENRSSVFSALLTDRTTLRKIASKELLPLWLPPICEVPDHGQRRRLLSQFIPLNRFTHRSQRVRHPDALDLNTTFGSLDSVDQFAMLDYVSTSPPLVANLQLKHGKADMLRICKSAKDPSRAHYVAQLKKIYQIWDLRSFAAVYSQGPGIIRELEQGSIKAFMGLCDTMPAKEADRSTLFIGQYPNVQTWFATSNQPEEIIRVFESIDEQERRERFALAFLGAGILGRQPGNKELVPEVVAYARKQSDDFQVKIAMTLVSQYATDDAAMKTDLPVFLVEKLKDEKIDLELMPLMLRSVNLIDLIEEHDLQRTVIDRILAAKDHASQADCINKLLESTHWQSLLSDDDIEAIITLTQQQSLEALSTLIRQQPYVLRRLIEMGKFDLAKRIATMRIENIDRDSQSWAFYVNDAVVRKERLTNKSATMLVRLLNAIKTDVLQRRLIELSKNGEAARWILDSYGWEPIADAIDRVPELDRRSIVDQMFRNPMFLEELSKSQQFPKLARDGPLREFLVGKIGYASLLRSHRLRQQLDPELWIGLVREGYEQSQAPMQRLSRMHLQNPQVWEIAIESGHGKWLLETLNQPDSAGSPQKQRQRRRDHVTSPYGLLRLAIRIGEFDAAEEMLSEFIDDDRGRLRLIRFQMHRQLIAQATGLTSKPSERFQSLLAKDRRLAAYWSRSQEDLPKAIEIARETGDMGLVWSLVLESRDWAALLELPVCKTKDLPVPPFAGDINPIHRRIEQLGFLTFLRQVSGQPGASTKPLMDWITRHAKTPNTPRYGADALLTVGEIDAARQLLNDHLPRRLFDWHRFRLDYVNALKCLHWEAITPQALFDQASGKDIGSQPLRMKAAEFLLQVAMVLQDAGRPQEIAPIMNALRSHAEHSDLNQSAKTTYLRDLAILMHDRGFPMESRQTISTCDDPKVIRSYFDRCYSDFSLPGGSADAVVWFNEFAGRYPDESRRQHLNRVDAAMRASTPIDELRPFPDFDGSVASSGVATTLYRYKRFDQVVAILRSLERPRHSDLVLLGKTHLAQENYTDAADAFYKAFQSNQNDLTRLYLSGHCWSKAGDDRKATELKLLARTLAVSEPISHGLAIGIAREGLQAEAQDLYRTLALHSLPSQLVRIESIRQLTLGEPDSRKRLEYATELALYHLRPIAFYSDLDVWLQSELDRRETQIMIAIQDHRFTDLKNHLQELDEISPADVSSTNRILKSLRQHGQENLAMETQASHQDYLERRLKESADSPVIKQRLKALLNR